MSNILDWCIQHPGVEVAFHFYRNFFVLRMTDTERNNTICRTLPLTRILTRNLTDDELEADMRELYKSLMENRKP